jgi:flotillin
LELQKTLEIQRGITIEEQLIAEKLSQVKVEAQRIVKVAEADYYKKCAEANAKLYSAQKSADALKMGFRSQAQGIVELSESLKGDNEAIIKYLMVEKEAFQNIAKGNTGALSGLKPHLNIMSAT